MRYEKKGYLQEEFRLFHLKDAQGAKTDYHYHEFCKVLFLVSGTGGYSIEGQRYLLKAGDIVLVGDHCAHRPEFEPGIPYERIIVYISPEFLMKHSSEDGNLWECFSGKAGHVFRPDEETRRMLFSRLGSLEQALRDTRYGRTIMSNSMLLQLLVEIVRGFHYEKGRMQEPMVPSEGCILDIVRYLDGHLTEDISIDELSERFYLSRFHMMRRFKEETGTTIHNYVSDRRLLLAKSMMEHGLSATEACFQCGFKSYAAFARAYGKFLGTTPTGKRKLAEAEEEAFE